MNNGGVKNEKLLRVIVGQIILRNFAESKLTCPKWNDQHH